MSVASDIIYGNAAARRIKSFSVILIWYARYAHTMEKRIRNRPPRKLESRYN